MNSKDFMLYPVFTTSGEENRALVVRFEKRRFDEGLNDKLRASLQNSSYIESDRSPQASNRTTHKLSKQLKCHRRVWKDLFEPRNDLDNESDETLNVNVWHDKDEWRRNKVISSLPCKRCNDDSRPLFSRTCSTDGGKGILSEREKKKTGFQYLKDSREWI